MSEVQNQYKPWEHEGVTEAQYWRKLYLEQRVMMHQATRIIYEYGSIEGDHHKAWVIDQVLRALTQEEYGGKETFECSAMTDDPTNKAWIKNEYKRGAIFSDGDEFLIAVPFQLKNRDGALEDKWDFAHVRVNCDFDFFEFVIANTDEPYDAWSWEDVEYYILLQGEGPTMREVNK